MVNTVSNPQLAPTPTATEKQSARTGVLSLPSAGGVLLASIGCLLVLSLIMVASASIPFAKSHGIDDLFFFQHQLAYIIIGTFAATVTYFMKLRWFYEMFVQVLALLTIIILLFLTLMIGDEINGSRRWLEIGAFNFQVAELVKLVMIVFTSDFVVRRASEVRQGLAGIFRMMAIMALISGLLLFQPDFGSLVIVVGIILSIFFIAGAPKIQFIGVLLAALVGGAFAISFQQYRVTRALSFLDPFDDIRGSDYQLARSLIAFGRGEFTGVGYGESVQKLAHLPEAHTDFLLAITGEELGFIGVMLVLLLEALIIASTMRISYLALKRRQMRLSYTAFGIAVMFIGQSVINAGMNMGVMPTKGLTMPFFSYGGSSMLVCLIMIGLLLRIHKQSPLIDPLDSRHY